MSTHLFHYLSHQEKKELIEILNRLTTGVISEEIKFLDRWMENLMNNAYRRYHFIQEHLEEAEQTPSSVMHYLSEAEKEELIFAMVELDSASSVRKPSIKSFFAKREWT